MAFRCGCGCVDVVVGVTGWVDLHVNEWEEVLVSWEPYVPYNNMICLSAC